MMTEELERYTSAVMKLTDLELEKEKLKQSLIPEEIREKLAEVDEEFEPMIAQAQQEKEIAQSEVIKVVLERGTTIRGSTHMAVYQKPRKSWDAELLDKLAIKYPEIELAKKEGKPSVAIRLIK